MITIAPMLTSLLRTCGLASIGSSGSLALLGIYYGFLTTLPMGPSQLLCVRAFLLEGEGREADSPGTVAKSGIVVAAIAGLAIPQLAVFFSMYWPPLCALWVRPHFWTALVFPYMLFSWSRMKYFDREGLVRRTSPFYDPRVWSVFLDSLFFQMLNPILLPSPVLTRLLSVFLFRYSQVPAFLLGGMVGWFSGQALFVFSSWFLLLRLERDTPTIYRLVKRVVHRAFPPIVFVLCFAYLGRAPMALFGKKWSPETESLQQKQWPDLFFDRDKPNRPLRALRSGVSGQREEGQKELSKDVQKAQREEEQKQQREKEQEVKIPWNKKRFSQSIFEACVSDGKRRLSHTYPQGLLALHTKLNTCLQMPHLSQQQETDVYDEWAASKEARRNQLFEALANRMEALDKGAATDSVLDKKTASSLSAETEEESLSKILDPRLDHHSRASRLVLGNQSPWLLPASDLFELEVLDGKENEQLVQSFRSNRLTDWISVKSENALDMLISVGEPVDSVSRVTLDKIDKIARNGAINQVSVPSPDNANLSLDSYSVSDDQNGAKVSNEVTLELANIQKSMPLWRMTEADIRTAPARASIGKKDFTRNLIKGSVRARRRKVLAWHLFQTAPHAPFVLRVGSFSDQKDGLTEAVTSWLPSRDAKFFGSRSESIADARAVKDKFDFLYAHFVRGPVLVLQSLLRKYVTLPILIIFKNGTRWLMFQQPEWEQDWSDWSQERYINCFYDGRDSSPNAWPPGWIQTGLQIRVVSPFRLRPWRSSSTASFENVGKGESSDIQMNSAKKGTLEDFSYLTIWGSEVEIPFGKVKRQPSFFKPTLKVLRLVLVRTSYRQLAQILRSADPLISFYRKLFPAQSLQNNLIHGTQSTALSSSKKILGSSDQPQDTASLVLDASRERKEETDLLQKNSVLQTSKQSPVGAQSREISQMGVTSYTRTNQANLAKEAECLRIRLAARPHAQALSSTQDNFEHNILTQYSLLGRPPIHLQPGQRASLGIRLLSEESQKSIRYKQLQIENKLLQVNSAGSEVKAQVHKLLSKMPTLTKKYATDIKKALFRWIRQLIRTLTSEIVRIHRKFTSVAEHLFQQVAKHTILLFAKQEEKQSMRTDILQESKDSISLSQAYILHRIWQTRVSNTLGLTSLMSLWDSGEYLQESLQTVLTDQGMFATQGPYVLTQNNWQEWIKDLPRYTPPSKLWVDISPRAWNTQVQQYWTKADNFEQSLRQQGKESVFDHLGKGLTYHRPLLQKAKKLLKRWKFDVLFQGYVASFSNEAFYKHSRSLIGPQQSTNQDSVTKDANIVQSTLSEKESSLGGKLEWGLSRTRQERRAPYLPRLLSEVEADELSASIDSATANAVESSSALLQDQGLYEQLETTDEYLSFSPVVHHKWKSRRLKSRLDRLREEVGRVQNLAQSSEKGNHKAYISESVNKDLSLFSDVFRLEEFKRRRVLFSSDLDHPSKVMDDETIMRSLVSPLLRSMHRQQDTVGLGASHLPIQPLLSGEALSSSNAFVPESILLPNKARELRVLQCLNFKAISHDSESKLISSLPPWLSLNVSSESAPSKSNFVTPKESKNNFLFAEDNERSRSTRILQRLLWPVHHLEDLACMNRFSIGAGNQSRFSALRIRMYPFMRP